MATGSINVSNKVSMEAPNVAATRLFFRCKYDNAEPTPITKINQFTAIINGVFQSLIPKVEPYVYSPNNKPVFVPIISIMKENKKTKIENKIKCLFQDELFQSKMPNINNK